MEPQTEPRASSPERGPITITQAADNEALSNYRLSTSVAALCKELCIKTAVKISGKNYVPVATMEAVAVAHGCVVGTRNVEYVQGAENTSGGFRCIAELRKVDQPDIVIAQAEGFVGVDEPVWFGGEIKKMNGNREVTQAYKKRPDFAIRAFCQTRAAGRVCKQAFAHVLVMMDVGLETAPLEEVVGVDTDVPAPDMAVSEYSGEPVTDWRDVYLDVPWSEKHGQGCKGEDGAVRPKGKQLGELSSQALGWFQQKFKPDPDKPIEVRIRRALDISLGKIEADKPAEKSAQTQESEPA